MCTFVGIKGHCIILYNLCRYVTFKRGQFIYIDIFYLVIILRYLWLKFDLISILTSSKFIFINNEKNEYFKLSDTDSLFLLELKLEIHMLLILYTNISLSFTNVGFYLKVFLQDLFHKNCHGTWVTFPNHSQKTLTQIKK